MPSSNSLRSMIDKRRLKALIKKELIQILRDPSSVIIAAFLPMLLMFLYSFGVSLDLDHLHIGLVMEDTAPDAQSFAKSLTDSPFFDVTIVRDEREILNDLEEGRIRGFVVIPSYFSKFRATPAEIAPIQVIADGSEPNTANFVQNYVRGAYVNWLAQEAISSDLRGLPLVTLEPRYWYNPELESRYFLLSGSLAIIMTLIGTLLTALVIAREWERGTMEALLSTPMTITEFILSKFLSYFALSMFSMALCVTTAVLVYGLPLRGSLLLMGLVSAVFSLAALGAGLLISTLARNQIIASQMALIVGFLPAYILSGFLFEIASMPKPIQWITYIIPAKYFVQCLQTLFMVGNVWSLILYNLIPMGVIGILLLIQTRRKTIKRLD